MLVRSFRRPVSAATIISMLWTDVNSLNWNLSSQFHDVSNPQYSALPVGLLNMYLVAVVNVSLALLVRRSLLTYHDQANGC
jgi:hypothetical protein